MWFGTAGAVPSSVSSVALPASLDFESIAASDQALVLSGTATEDGDQGVECVMAKVTPPSFAIGTLIEPRCDDPRRLVAPIEVDEQTSRSMQTSVRISRIDPTTGHIDVGPVVVTYTEISDSHLEIAQGPDYLWLYAPITPKGAQALRISDATGAVLQDTTISPAMDRPVIAANADGLFLAQAGNSGFLGSSGSNSVNDVAIFRLGVGASNVEPFDVPSNSSFQGFSSWMTGSGNSLWADICARPTYACKITRFDGTSGKPAYSVTEPGDDADFGWVVGNATTGLYSIEPIGSAETTSYQVVRIAPDTGAVSSLATITLPAFFNEGAGAAVVADGALYFLAPPTAPAGGSLPGRLYRVALGAAS